MSNAKRIGFLGAVLCFACALAGGAAAPGETPGACAAPSSGEGALGIQVVALRLSEAGQLLDLRYRVVDPQKAHACLGHGVRPRLEDPSTGLVLSVPEMPTIGALRQTAVAPLAGKVYFILFGNAGTAVKAGSRVRLVVGEVKVENLLVE